MPFLVKTIENQKSFISMGKIFFAMGKG